MDGDTSMFCAGIEVTPSFYVNIVEHIGMKTKTGLEQWFKGYLIGELMKTARIFGALWSRTLASQKVAATKSVKDI